jgi:hypothetical protein
MNYTSGLFAAQKIEKTKQTPPIAYISKVIAKRDAAMGVAAFARQPCYLIPPPRFRSVALRPTLSGGLPFTSFVYPQTCPVKYLARDQRSEFKRGYAD